jgi:hypothetical protein
LSPRHLLIIRSKKRSRRKSVWARALNLRIRQMCSLQSTSKHSGCFSLQISKRERHYVYTLKKRQVITRLTNSMLWPIKFGDMENLVILTGIHMKDNGFKIRNKVRVY